MNDSNKTPVKSDCPTVQVHLTILQSVIQRMAENSSSAKTWCITLVSAVLIVIVEKQKLQFLWVTAFPVLSFAALDVYYLSFEKRFRASYERFVSKLHRNELVSEDLFKVVPEGDSVDYHLESLFSFSIWGFYIGIAILLVIVRYGLGGGES